MLDIFSYSFGINAFVGGFFVSILLGVVGVLISANKAHNLVGAIAHGAYGGIGISVYFALPLFLCIFGVVATSAIVLSILAYKQQENINIFSSIFWAGGMAIGVFLIEQVPNVVYGNLMSFLFGSILLIDNSDILVLSLSCIVVVALVVFFYDCILCVCLSKEYAQVKNINSQVVYSAIILFSSLAIVISTKTIGLILVLSLISVAPFLASFVASSLYMLMLISSLLCFVFIVCGLSISFFYDINSSVAIILFSIFCLFLSLLIRAIKQYNLN